VLFSQSSNKPLVRALCLPDLDKAIGGVKQLYRHVEHLISLGWDAEIITEGDGFRPSWFDSTAPTISLKESYLRGEINAASTILILPETYLGADLTSFRGFNLSGLARIVFNQNAYYSYGLTPSNPVTASSLESFYDDPAVLQVLSISEDTHDFLAHNLSIPDERLSRVVNAIEPFFVDDQPKTNRLHWMPRKNPDHVQAVLQGLQRSRVDHIGSWQGEPLENLAHEHVALRFAGARLFLAFGHPEGFGLPIAEAMASGCWVVGYSGGGGKELFRFGASNEVSFGDWTGFINSVHDCLKGFATAPNEMNFRLKRQALAIRSLYGRQQELDSISIAWERIAIQFEKWRLN